MQLQLKANTNAGRPHPRPLSRKRARGDVVRPLSPTTSWCPERVRVRACIHSRTMDGPIGNLSPAGRPHPRPLSQRARGGRRGAVLLVVLAAFVLAAALFAMLGRTVVVGHRAAQSRLWAAQAQWLAEAALERAAARLKSSPDYKGETWTIAAEELDGRHAGVVRIEVKPAGDDAAAPRKVRVEADFPDHPTHRARAEKILFSAF